MATPALKARAIKHSLLYKRAPDQPACILTDCLRVTPKTIIESPSCNSRSTKTNSRSRPSGCLRDEKETDTSLEATGRETQKPDPKPATHILLKPATHIPLKPANHIPLKPATHIPLKPATHIPVQPATHIPVQPASHIHVKPATHIPVKPATHIPVKPATHIPVKSATHIPVKPATHIPVKPATHIPLKPATQVAVNQPICPAPSCRQQVGSNNNMAYTQFSCPVLNVRIKTKAIDFGTSTPPSTPHPVPAISQEDRVDSSAKMDRDDDTVASGRRGGIPAKARTKGSRDKKEAASGKSKDSGKGRLPSNSNGNGSPRSSASRARRVTSFPWKQADGFNQSDGLWVVTSQRVRAVTGDRRELKRSKTSTGCYQDARERVPARDSKSARSQRYITTPPNPHGHNSMTETEISVTCLKLEEFLYNNNFPKFLDVLQQYSPTGKHTLVDFKANTSTANLFFRACGLVRLPFVTWMLDHCQPDLELTGPFYLVNDHTQYLVTPLWQAAASGSLHLVRILRDHGADPDALSDSGSSPLLAACYTSRLDVATYLVASKVQVSSCNHQGLTCLMAAVQSVDLVRLLVLNGAEINRWDHHGNTAMHYAVEEGRVKTVEILLELGGNPLVANRDGLTAVDTAAKYRHKDVLELLIRLSPLSVEGIVRLYEMFGATVTLMDDDLDEGFVYLHKATTLRHLDKSKVIHKPAIPSLLADKNDRAEFTTVQQLSRVATDSTRLRIQALMVHERLWGSNHNYFLQLLLYCGATFADSLNFQEAGKLWRLSYQLHLEKHVLDENLPEPFHYNLLKSLGFLVKLLFQWRRVMATAQTARDDGSRSSWSDSFYISQTARDDGSRSSWSDSFYISQDDVRRVLTLLCGHCLAAHAWLQGQSPTQCQRFREAFHVLLSSSLCTLLVYVESFSREERNEAVWPHVENLVKSDPRGDTNETLLHMSLCPGTLGKLNLDVSQTNLNWPSVTVIDILLILGSNPKHTNRQGNTPLHLAAILRGEGRLPEADRIFQSLLSKGGHADQVNGAGVTFYQMMEAQGYQAACHREISLKCLSARVLTSRGLEYIGQVPTSLYSFIELHRSVQEEAHSPRGKLHRK